MNGTSALGWALLHFLWQGMLIALLARLVLSLLPRRHASARYAIAAGALALMPATVVYSLLRGIGTGASVELARVGEPLDRELEREEGAPRSGHEVSLAPSEAPSVSEPDPAASAHALGAAAFEAAPSWKQRVDGALPWIVSAWVLGVVALALRLLVGYSTLRRIVRARGEPVPEAVTAMVARLAARLGVSRAVRVCSSGLTRVPAVAGWLAPVVLLPASAVTGLSRSQLEAVLAHELAHVRRHDYLVNLLQTLIETLLFYHPGVWWLGARIREEREHCCDDLAVAACGSAPLYAEALLSMERLRRAPELALALTGGSLLARVERLLAPRSQAAELFPRWLAGMSAVAIVLVFAATTDLASASRAQRERVRAEQVPTGADEVLLVPEPSEALAARAGWAHAEASKRRWSEYWVGHSIAPTPAFPEGILMGSFEHSGGLELGDGDSQVTLMGGILSSGDFGELNLPGVPLAPLVRADPAEVGVLYLWSARANGLAIRRVHLATAALPIDLEGLPLLWLDRADDRDSVQDALAGMGRVQEDGLRRQLLGIVGAHGTSAIVVPELTRILGSASHDEELRGEAAEWLARHPVMDALRALDAAARGDRNQEVRCEAAEAVSEMRFAPAFDALVALARELTDSEARREAVEGLGQRTEPGAIPALLDIANGDADPDVQSEAVETLGDLPKGAGLSTLSAIARSHPDESVRCEAVETYGECAPVGEALAFLQVLVASDPHPEVRCEAVETLGELHDGRVVDILSAIVEREGDAEVQREAVETLGETILGSAVAPVLERIARHHPRVDVQCEAVETLGDLREEGHRILDIVAGLATDHPSEPVRAEAAETLGDICPPAAAQALFDRLLGAERSPLVRKKLRQALEELREDDR